MDDHNNYEPFDAFGVVHQTLVDGCAVIEQQNNRDIESMARLLGVTDEWLANLKKPLTTEMDEKLRDDQAIRNLIYSSAVHSDPAGVYIDLPPGAMRQMPAYSEPSNYERLMAMKNRAPGETVMQMYGRLLNDSWVVNLRTGPSVFDELEYYGGFRGPALKNRLLDRLKCRLRQHLEKRLDHLLWLVESERVGRFTTRSDGLPSLTQYALLKPPPVKHDPTY